MAQTPAPIAARDHVALAQPLSLAELLDQTFGTDEEAGR